MVYFRRLSYRTGVVFLIAIGHTVLASGQDAQHTSPPLPFHTIEGYGGGAITPMAYLVNPDRAPETLPGMSVAFSSVVLGGKTLQSLTFTQNLFGRIELGYAVNRLGMGSLPDDIQDIAGVDIGTHHLWLHHFNLRGMLLAEEPDGLLPALTAGVHFKINDGIDAINDACRGALEGIGYGKPYGVDYTLTASKTLLGALTFDRPLIVTGGLRNSSAAQLGLLGFGTHRTTTFEGSVAFLPADQWLIAYEYRQKCSPYRVINGLVEKEDDWHAVDLGYIVDDHTTIVLGWGAFGQVANSKENGAWWLQVKYEF